MIHAIQLEPRTTILCGEAIAQVAAPMWGQSHREVSMSDPSGVAGDCDVLILLEADPRFLESMLRAGMSERVRREAALCRISLDPEGSAQTWSVFTREPEASGPVISLRLVNLEERVFDPRALARAAQMIHGMVGGDPWGHRAASSPRRSDGSKLRGWNGGTIYYAAESGSLEIAHPLDRIEAALPPAARSDARRWCGNLVLDIRGEFNLLVQFDELGSNFDAWFPPGADVSCFTEDLSPVPRLHDVELCEPPRVLRRLG